MFVFYLLMVKYKKRITITSSQSNPSPLKEGGGCNLDLVAGYPVPFVLFMTDMSFKPMFQKYRPGL